VDAVARAELLADGADLEAQHLAEEREGRVVLPVDLGEREGDGDRGLHRLLVELGEGPHLARLRLRRPRPLAACLRLLPGRAPVAELRVAEVGLEVLGGEVAVEAAGYDDRR